MHRTLRIWAPLVLVAIASVAIPSELLTGKCVGVTDGDTISVLVEQHPVKVRLEGIDCPESGQDFGTRARQRTSDLVFGKDVSVNVTGQDRYGRTLGVVWVGQTNVNLELVRSGLAWHYKQYSSDRVLAEAETAARAAGVGLWSHADPTPPWAYRRGGQVQSSPSSNSTEDLEVVYVTRTGKKYHRDGCRYLSQSRIPMPLQEASTRYGPCSVCRPPIFNAESTTSTMAAHQQPRGETLVYVNESGTEYHMEGCPSLQGGGKPIDLSVARALYQRCTICSPPS